MRLRNQRAQKTTCVLSMLVTDLAGKPTRIPAGFFTLRGSHIWGTDGTPVDLTEELRNTFSSSTLTKVEAEELFLGRMVRCIGNAEKEPRNGYKTNVNVRSFSRRCLQKTCGKGILIR